MQAFFTPEKADLTPDTHYLKLMRIDWAVNIFKRLTFHLLGRIKVNLWFCKLHSSIKIIIFLICRICVEWLLLKFLLLNLLICKLLDGNHTKIWGTANFLKVLLMVGNLAKILRANVHGILITHVNSLWSSTCFIHYFGRLFLRRKVVWLWWF
jgi:hypothetical protein